MPRRVFFTPEAEYSLSLIESYIFNNFGYKRLLQFDQDFDIFLNQIVALPNAGRLLETPHGLFHERVFQKLTSLYYTIEDEIIVIQFVYDNRQDKKFTTKGR
jgi:plasmid stabilization system protein ParE